MSPDIKIINKESMPGLWPLRESPGGENVVKITIPHVIQGRNKL